MYAESWDISTESDAPSTLKSVNFVTHLLRFTDWQKGLAFRLIERRKRNCWNAFVHKGLHEERENVVTQLYMQDVALFDAMSYYMAAAAPSRH